VITAAALLVLVALGLFVWGIAAGSTALYWACVAVSAVAAVLLVAAFLRMRREVGAVGPGRSPARRSRPERAPATRGDDAPSPVGSAPGGHVSGGGEGDLAHAADYAPAGPGSSTRLTDDGAPERPASAPPSAGGADEDPPAEEVEVTDLLLVVDLHDEVHVVDEHPRYHLAECPWLAGRTTIPLPLDEARTDGFTPCAVCAPDHGLAERERSRRAPRGPS
jgi:hypothetical protein